MKKLFMLSIGGNAQGTNIEVHDVQFVIAETIEATYDIVKNLWYGSMYQLHLDSYKEIKGVGDYLVSIEEEHKASKGNDPQDLGIYFACLGGYKPTSTQEIHNVGLIVSQSLEEAKARAMKEIELECDQKHLDNIMDIGPILHSDDGGKYSLKLEKSNMSYDLLPDWYGYKRLDQ